MRAVFFSIPVADYPSTCTWYARVMGRDADMTPNDNEMCWQLTDKAWLYVIHDAKRAGTALLTLIVDDLEQHVSELGKRGISVISTEATDHYRKANIVDPEGNILSFCEVNDA